MHKLEVLYCIYPQCLPAATFGAAHKYQDALEQEQYEQRVEQWAQQHYIIPKQDIERVRQYESDSAGRFVVFTLAKNAHT